MSNDALINYEEAKGGYMKTLKDLGMLPTCHKDCVEKSKERCWCINDALSEIGDIPLSKILKAAKGMIEIDVESHMEEICEQVHKAYCKYKKEQTGENYWTKGDYSLLKDEGKEYDRRTVRAVATQISKVGVRCKEHETKKGLK